MATTNHKRHLFTKSDCLIPSSSTDHKSQIQETIFNRVIQLRDYLRANADKHKPLAEANLELNVQLYLFLVYGKKPDEEQFQKALAAFK
jgi:hypothetical protein